VNIGPNGKTLIHTGVRDAQSIADYIRFAKQLAAGARRLKQQTHFLAKAREATSTRAARAAALDRRIEQAAKSLTKYSQRGRARNIARALNAEELEKAKQDTKYVPVSVTPTAIRHRLRKLGLL
jgi:hypothetical protein